MLFALPSLVSVEHLVEMLGPDTDHSLSFLEDFFFGLFRLRFA